MFVEFLEKIPHEPVIAWLNSFPSMGQHLSVNGTAYLFHSNTKIDQKLFGAVSFESHKVELRLMESMLTFGSPYQKLPKRSELATLYFNVKLLQYHEDLGNTDSLVSKWSQHVQRPNTVVMDPHGLH